MENNAVVNNESKKRFEYKHKKSFAVINYKIMDNKILLLSTQVPEELSGKGVGSNLVKQTFDLIENMDLKVVPVCNFVQRWLTKNPEKHNLLA